MLGAGGGEWGEEPLDCDLRLSGTPVSIGAALDGTATISPAERVTVGDETVSARPLRIALDVTGDLSGTWTETIWIDEDNLPVRIHRDLSLSGPATFGETSELDLLDRTPRT